MADIHDLEKQLLDHVKVDEDQFRALRDGLSDIKEQIVKHGRLAAEVHEAIVGSNTERGLRERVRTLEDGAKDHQWWMRAAWLAIIAEGAVILFRVLKLGFVTT